MLAVERKSGKTLKTLDEAPEVPAEMIDLWEAFLFLSTSRQIGMAIGFIPLSEIESFARMTDQESPLRFAAEIRYLDQIWIDCQRKKEQSKPAHGTGTSKYPSKRAEGNR